MTSEFQSIDPADYQDLIEDSRTQKKLNAREARVIELLMQGRTVTQIAATVGLARPTIYEMIRRPRVAVALADIDSQTIVRIARRGLLLAEQAQMIVALGLNPDLPKKKRPDALQTKLAIETLKRLAPLLSQAVTFSKLAELERRLADFYEAAELDSGLDEDDEDG